MCQTVAVRGVVRDCLLRWSIVEQLVPSLVVGNLDAWDLARQVND